MTAPYPYAPPPAPTADPNSVLRLLAGILGLLAAALVLAGSFLPQTSFEQIVDGKTESQLAISAWSRSFDVEPSDEAKAFYDKTHVARYGIPLTAGAVVLLAGAGLAFAGARRSAGAGVRSGARTALVAGGAGVTAAVWMLGMDVSATLSYESDEGSVKSHYATGTGFWLLLGGGVVALLVVVFAILAGRRGRAAGPPPQQQQQSRPYPAPPRQFAGYPGGPPHPGGQPYPGGPPSQPFPAQGGPGPRPGGPQSHPFPAQGGPISQPFPARPEPATPPRGESMPPSPAQPGDLSARNEDPYGEATQAHPPPSAEPASPTEPNYQLPPLKPPNT